MEIDISITHCLTHCRNWKLSASAFT
jgi:hypothetical protein